MCFCKIPSRYILSSFLIIFNRENYYKYFFSNTHGVSCSEVLVIEGVVLKSILDDHEDVRSPYNTKD